MVRGLVGFVAGVVLLAACYPEPGKPVVRDAATADAATSDAAIDRTPMPGGCPEGTVVGGVAVSQTEAGALTLIRAWLQNAYEPRFHPEPVAVDGDCVYMMPTTPVCDPPCGDFYRYICTLEHQCRLAPQPRDLGEIMMTFGRSGTDPALSFTVAGSLDISDPYPLLVPGAEIVARSSAGDHEPFTLRALGVATVGPVTVPGGATFTGGLPLAVTWTPGGQPEVGRVSVRLSSTWDTGPPGDVVCDFADTGAAVIPASMVSRQADYGMPLMLGVYRSTAESVFIAGGCVTLQVGSSDGLQLTPAPLGQP